jgi:hypothetical protein
MKNRPEIGQSQPKNLPSGALGAAMAILGLFLTLPCAGMERFSALSMLETGNNPQAIGSKGERGSYQFLPQTWREYTTMPLERACVPADALLVAKAVMERRTAQFQRQFHRQPTDLEWYCLWNAPNQVQKPSCAVSHRATRFANLCQKPN